MFIEFAGTQHGESIATIAYINEYGKTNQPARPFIATANAKCENEAVEKAASVFPDYIDELETGHPPVKDGGKRLSFKKDYQSIRDWLNAKGLEMNIASLISRLNTKGSLLYQQKGFRNIYSQDVSDPSFIEKVQNELSNNFLVRVNKDIETYIKI